MGDLLDEDLEFRGGTLQLSSEQVAVETLRCGTTEETHRNKPKTNADPSVLSGADSLSSSSSSFADARTEAAPGATVNAESSPSFASQPVYPRYDVPFSRENIQDFFTFRRGVVENAIQECITGLLFPEDGEYLGSWLLTEITLWDNEKERIVLLTSRLVMTIKYDFIAMKQLDFKKTYLDDLDTIVIGELVYPPSSLVPCPMSHSCTDGHTSSYPKPVLMELVRASPSGSRELTRLNGIATGVSTVVKDQVLDRLCRRPSSDGGNAKLFDPKYFEPRERNLRGVRLMWNKGEPLPLKTMWNPFTQDVPFITFASHPIYWHKDGDPEERSTYDMEIFAQKLQRAIEAMPTSSCCIHHSPIVIQSYVGVTSLLHNKTSMGFFKVRGKFSF